MFGGNGRVDWAALIIIVPVSATILGVVLVALAALTARTPETRQYYLRLIAHLTHYVEVLRSRR